MDVWAGCHPDEKEQPRTFLRGEGSSIDRFFMNQNIRASVVGMSCGHIPGLWKGFTDHCLLAVEVANLFRLIPLVAVPKMKIPPTARYEDREKFVPYYQAVDLLHKGHTWANDPAKDCKTLHELLYKCGEATFGVSVPKARATGERHSKGTLASLRRLALSEMDEKQRGDEVTKFKGKLRKEKEKSAQHRLAWFENLRKMSRRLLHRVLFRAAAAVTPVVSFVTKDPARAIAEVTTDPEKVLAG